jgi:rubrerythrin
MEIDGQKFYELAAAQAPLKELSEIFRYLAEEEKRHFRFFKSLAEGHTESADRELSGSEMKEPRNIFVGLIESGAHSKFGDETMSAWKKAREIEEQAVRLYTEEAKRENDAGRRQLLERIAAEEQNHFYLIENVLAYLKDPGTFADSQRFATFKSWEGH